MALTAEQLTIIRSTLDASGYQAGAKAITDANKQIVQSGTTVTETQTKLTRSLTDSGGAIERLKRQLIPGYEALAQFNRQSDLVNRSLERGRINASEASLLHQLSAKRYEESTVALNHMAASANHNALAMRNLALQAPDVFVQLASGQGVMRTFIQQGSQIGQVAVAQGVGFSAFASGIRSAIASINPYIAAAVLGTAAITAFGVASESSLRRTAALQNSLRATRNDYVAMSAASEAAARAIAGRTTIGLTDARAAAGTIAAAPQFQGTQQQLERLVTIAKAASITFGDDLPTAAKNLAAAMDDPARVIQDMANRHMRGFNQQMADSARLMQQGGDKAGAFEKYLSGLRATTAGATENLTPLQAALQNLENVFTRAGANGRSFAEDIGAPAVQAVADLLTGITQLIDSVKRLKDEFVNLIPQSVLDAIKWINEHDPTRMAMNLIQRPGTPVQSGGVIQNDGAIGMFQLRSGAAADVGMSSADRFNESRNIIGGLQYFRQQLEEFGNLNDATRAFNQGALGARRGGGTDYLASVRAQDIGRLPPAARDQIERTFGTIFSDIARTAMGPETLQRILQIAMQESGGRHFAPSAIAAPTGTGGEGGGVGSPATAGPPGAVASPSGVANIRPQDEARLLANQQNSIFDTRARLSAQRSALQAGLDAARLAGDNADIERFTRALNVLEGEYRRAVGAQEDFVRGLERQAETAGIVTEGDRKIFEARRQLDELDRQHPETAASAEQRQRALNAVLAEQSGAYRVLIGDIDRQISNQDSLTNALIKGGDAAIHAQAGIQAVNDALKLGPSSGAAYEATVASLTRKYEDLAVAANRAKLAQQINANDNQIAMLNAQSQSLSMNNEQRQTMLVRLKAEQDLKAAGIDAETELGRRYLSSADALASTTAAFDRQKAALDDIAGAFSSSFDTIGNAITQSLLSGQGAAVNWRNVMTSVSQQVLQQFLKLAVLNPLLNEMFGGNRSTIGGVVGALGGGGGAGMFGLLGQFGGIFGPSATTLANMTGAAASGLGVSALTASSGLLVGGVHEGGTVGRDPWTFMRRVPANDFAGAPRLHTGLQSDEFAAILRRNETVLTEQQTRAVGGMLRDGRDREGGNVINISISTPDADSFRRSQSQVASVIASGLSRATRKTGTRA